MLLVFSPNWFPIFICLVNLATEHTFSFLFVKQTHTNTHWAFHFFFLFTDICSLVVDSIIICCGCRHQWAARISNYVEVNSTYTHMHLHSWECTECSVDSMGGGESFYTSCLFQSDTFPALARVIRTRGGTVTQQLLYILLPKSMSIVCLGLSSCHLTQQLTIPLKLTV